MYTMFEWMQSLDPVKVEAERFAVYRPDGDKTQDVVEPHRPPVMTPTRKERRKMARQSVTQGLNLSPAQQRAVNKWMEGLDNE